LSADLAGRADRQRSEVEALRLRAVALAFGL
jgi:hypothetical protein